MALAVQNVVTVVVNALIDPSAVAPDRPDPTLASAQIAPNPGKELGLPIRGAQALDADPNLSEFTLPPANSFYRRLQHEEVKKIGYHSRSDGEGQQRSVVMLRYPPESGDET